MNHNRDVPLITKLKDSSIIGSPKYCKKLNDYVLIKCIGTGSSSKVFFSIKDGTEERYAIKVIKLRDLVHASSSPINFEREIRLMHTLKHRNILQLYEVLYNPNNISVCLVLEYAANGSLGKIISTKVQLPQKSIFSFIKQIAEALIYIHSKGFVHQDIKPDNILIDKNGRAMLADFGIGHSFQSATMVVGSPAYQAPEALNDDADMISTTDHHPQKEDVWALGITLYQLLFLKLPYTGENLFEIVHAINSKNLDIPESTDIELAKLLEGMLCVEPKERWSISQVRKFKLIDEADDFAANLPEQIEPSVENVGEILQINVEVCDGNFSFVEHMLEQSKQTSQSNSFLMSSDSDSEGSDIIVSTTNNTFFNKNKENSGHHQ